MKKLTQNTGFTDIFIKRPVFATVLSLIILLVGAISFTKLPVRQYPRVDDTNIVISTSFPGADAQLMESFITGPLENALAGVDGIDYQYSNSSQGQSTISVHFDLGYDINTAASDVSSKVSSARWQLPQGVDDPVVTKRDPNATPTLFVGFTSDVLSGEAITDYLKRVLVPQISTLPGVGEVDAFGSQTYAMRIWLNPYLMAAHNVTLNDVSNAIYNNNQQSPTGFIETNLSELPVSASTSIDTAAQFANLVIKNNNDQLIRIKDIGRTELGPESMRSSAIIDGKTSVLMAITPQPTANPLEVSTVVQRSLNLIKPQLPQGLSMKVVWDTSKFIAASISEVKKTVFEAALAVLLVMFVFLGSMRVLSIPAVTIPLSLIGVCSWMLVLGFSINTLTLLAMVLAIGMVVDDSIVVTENIHRHIESGKTPFNAALIGAREIQFAIIAMTCTLAAVFAPIGFMSDITGALFKEFAFTLASAVIISGFIALTLSPMMCSKIMTAKTNHHNKFNLFIEKIFNFFIEKYRYALTYVMRHNKWIIFCFLGLVSTVGILYATLPQELAPEEDMSAIYVQLNGPPGANLQYMEKYSKELIPIYNKMPEKMGYAIFNGSGQAMNTGGSFIVLKPWSQRKRNVSEIIQSIFPQLWQIPGIQAFPLNPFRLPGSNAMTPVRFVLKTTGSYEELAASMEKLTELVNKNPGFVNVSSDLKFDQPQITIAIDRDKAGDLGIPMNDIGTALNIALGQPTTGYFEMNGQSYDVVPELDNQYMDQPNIIANLYLRTASGSLVPMSNLVKLGEITAPETLSHFQEERSATLSASLKPGYTLGQALNYLEANAKKIMPSNMQYDFSGTSRQFIQASNSMEKTFIFALLFIFLILAAQFESFIDPFIVLLSVIPAIFGALMVLKITGSTINIYTEIGLVTLIGLISKHGILMVEFANQQLQQKHSLRDAIILAAVTRFRPILMTTLAMVLGAIPLIFATGASALSRKEIGYVIVGGMSFGTCVTLFIVPCSFIIIKNLFKKRTTAVLEAH